MFSAFYKATKAVLLLLFQKVLEYKAVSKTSLMHAFDVMLAQATYKQVIL